MDKRPFLNGKGFTLISVAIEWASATFAGTPREVCVNGVALNVTEGVEGVKGGMDVVGHTGVIVHNFQICSRTLFNYLQS